MKSLKWLWKPRSTKMYKQVIIVRQDLKLPKGKLAVQVAHASVESALKADSKVLSDWRRNGAKKVVVKVENQKELEKFLGIADSEGIPKYLVSDAGRTVIEPGTKTALGLGPADEELLEKLTGSLKMV